MKFKKPNGLITLICMSLSFLMSGHAGELHGQNISTQTISPLETAYHRALELHHTAEGASLADSLYTISVKSGEKKMQCDLLKLMVEYYVTTNDDEKVKEICERLRSVAVNTDNENDVFWSYRQQVKYLVDHTRLLEAIDLTDEMKRNAEKMASVFGTYLMHLTVGDIYKARNDKEIARDSYIKAMNLQKRYLPDVDATMPHIYLS
ncbi:MAG: hypothetical protein K2K37_10275 [Muribaculaceae bacterium]|nr:hypothetical protein [Muribaculaceae bacterium]